MSTPMDALLRSYVAARAAEAEAIPAARRQQLAELGTFIAEQTSGGRPARLLFVCTHNSRRSQLAQVWAWVAAAHLGLDKVAAFSGGTEATAFAPSAVEALRRAGLLVEKVTREPNPVYRAVLENGGPAVALDCFSKRWDQPPNPGTGFCAVMVCSAADEACPVIAGADLRLALPFDDPKRADGTDNEDAAYDDACRRIAREMLFAMSRVRG